MGIQTIKTELKSAGGSYKIECTARNKTIILDEPEELGGSDGGMNPGEALLCALGGCKYIVAKMFYQKLGINLIKINIEMEGEVDPDALTNKANGNNKNQDIRIGFTKITTRWFVDANNTKEEIDEFIDFIENHCPMLDTLSNPPEFKTEVCGKKS
ncbi:OsmC family protein [Sedimentibacter sp.]|uniref:OsmC family protein n=1 Tax=Sedimentibacter sp. TaxID=1960295 RepID=UPI00289CA7E2|nr:OsmC family protein [Sedimentibacter sp.]